MLWSLFIQIIRAYTNLPWASLHSLSWPGLLVLPQYKQGHQSDLHPNSHNNHYHSDCNHPSTSTNVQYASTLITASIPQFTKIRTVVVLAGVKGEKGGGLGEGDFRVISPYMYRLKRQPELYLSCPSGHFSLNCPCPVLTDTPCPLYLSWPPRHFKIYVHIYTNKGSSGTYKCIPNASKRVDHNSAGLPIM